MNNDSTIQSIDCTTQSTEQTIYPQLNSINPNPALEEQLPTEVCTYTIQELKDDENFESRFFNKKFLNARKAQDLKFKAYYDVPKRMSEIVKIAQGKFKRTRTIPIDLTKKGEDLFLWYIIAFVKKDVSVSYDKYPFSFDVQTPEAKQRVLDTKLTIKTIKDLSRVALF